MKHNRRNLCRVASLSMVLLLSLILQGQSSGTQPANLALHLTAYDLVNGIPNTFSFVFVNVSDHEVRVPPMSPCVLDGDAGQVILVLLFQRSYGTVTTGQGGGCGGGVGGSDMPGILERARSWTSLGRGESLTKTYKRSDLFVYEQGPGAYNFWAEYKPPEFTPEDIAALERARIDFPRQVLRSASLRFQRARTR
jgi:hypothetical protein